MSEKPCGAYFFAFFEKFVAPILTSGGYVGLSLGVLFAQHHQVVAVDIVQAKGQTYTNIEVIVVNDNAPTTENAEIVKETIKNYGDVKNGIRLINNPQNVGGAEARNIGLHNSNGTYVAFLDDDDEILPNKIEQQVKFLEENPNVSYQN